MERNVCLKCTTIKELDDIFWLGNKLGLEIGTAWTYRQSATMIEDHGFAYFFTGPGLILGLSGIPFYTVSDILNKSPDGLLLKMYCNTEDLLGPPDKGST